MRIVGDLDREHISYHNGSKRAVPARWRLSALGKADRTTFEATDLDGEEE